MERAELYHALRAWRSKEPGAGGREPILISEPDPIRFMTAFATTVAGESQVILGDPNWGETERSQLHELLARRSLLPAPPASGGWLMIPTGGSSGGLKFARHDQETIGAAIDGFLKHFGLSRVNAVGVLPLHHVSGFMAWMRSAWSGGEYRHLGWKEIERGELPVLPAKKDGWVLSLVPTQLERLLQNESCRAESPVPAVPRRRGSETPPYLDTIAWLRQFRIIFLGGAPAAPALLDKAAGFGLRLSLGYGMTETVAMVTALLPEEFLGGRRDSGRALPHASVCVGVDGLVRIKAGSLFRGYFPSWREDGEFATADLGRIDAAGHLTVLGRADGVIITGGEKVLPSEVERVLLATGEFAQVVVVGVPDAEWGQAVVVAYPASERPDLVKVAALVGDRLSAWKRPKRYVALADWPGTATGKVNRALVVERLIDLKPET